MRTARYPRPVLRCRALTALLGVGVSALVVLADAEPSSPRVQLPSLLIDVGHKTTPAPSSRLLVNPSLQHFGETAAGTAVRRDFTLHNDGNDLVIGVAEPQGPFRVVAGSPYVLQPGEIRTVAVEFVPMKAGAYSGIITFQGEYHDTAIVAGAAFASGTQSGTMQLAPASAGLGVEIVVLGDGTSFQIRWRSVPGQPYQLAYSEDLTNWQPMGDAVIASGPVTAVLDDGSRTMPPPVAVAARFYRVGGGKNAIVGFRRVRLNADETPISVPFLKSIVAQGRVGAVSAQSVTDSNATFLTGEFRYDPATQPRTFLFALASGPHAGRSFLIADNETTSIHMDDPAQQIDLRQFIRIGDEYIIYPLFRIEDVFGSPSETVLKATDRIFFWDAVAQTYEPVISLETLASDGRLHWSRESLPADNLPVFPGEGLMVKRFAEVPTELVLAGAVSPIPILHEIVAGNNLVGHGSPVAISPGETDLLSSGFRGGTMFSNSDKIHLFHARKQHFKTTLWYNSLLDRWLSPSPEVHPTKLKLEPGEAFFLYRTQLRGFEWVQQPPSE